MNISHELVIPEHMAGMRVDAAAAELLPEYSRAKVQQWIKQQKLLLNQQPTKPKIKIEGGEQLNLQAELEIETFNTPENIALNVLYQDDDLIVINKPVGLVTHPGAGNPSGTLLNGLLYHFPELEQLPRAGIVHRLDKDTSGVMVVARSLPAYTALVAALQERLISREYLALIPGEVTAGSTITAAMSRHPKTRLKMAVHPLGKPAVTHYRIEERLPYHTLLSVHLETGRTHQIRVHMAHKLRPIVGDQTYGRLHMPKGCGDETRHALQNFKRQALHAKTLCFEHPITKAPMAFTAPLADDFSQLLKQLRKASDD